MSAIRIRMAEDADNDKILELARRCPQEGMISFFPIRSPQFNTVHKLFDPDAWHMVACTDADIIGLVGVMHFRGRVSDREYKIAYILDLKLDKAYRNGTTSFRLVRAAVNRLMDSDADLVIANFLKDNQRSLVFTTGRVGLPPSYYLGDNRVFNIIPLMFMKPDKRFEICKPGQEDIPEMLALFRKYAAGYQIAPAVTDHFLDNYFDSIEGLTLDRFLIAREGGRIKAMTALWDEHVYKMYQVQHLSSKIRLAALALRFLSVFTRVPQPIRLNEPLRQLSLVLYAHDECPEALDTLFRHANNIHLGTEYTLIKLYAQERDPLFQRMKRFTAVSIHSEMHLFAKDPSVLDRLSGANTPVLPDLALLL